MIRHSWKEKKAPTAQARRTILAVLFLAFAFLSIPAGETLAGRDLFVSDITHIIRYDGTTGALVGVFVASGSGGLDGPFGLTFGPDGNLYVSSFYTNSVLKYNGSTGAFLGVFVSAGSGGLGNPIGLTFGPDNNLYVISYNGQKVLRYDGTTGGFIDQFTADSTLNAPIDLDFSPAGDLYVTNNSAASVSKYDSAGVFQGAAPIPPIPADPDPIPVTPYGIAFGPDGDFYVGGYNSASVIRASVAGGAVNFLGDFATGASLPYGVTFGPDGNLYVTAYGGHKVIRYNGTTGAYIDDFVTTGLGGLSFPLFLTFAPPKYYTISTTPSGPGNISCTPNPVAETLDSLCVMTPSLYNHVSDLAVGPAGQALSPIGPVWTYVFKNINEDKEIEASFAGNHFWLFDSFMSGTTATGTLNAAIVQAASGSDILIRIESGAYFEGIGATCSDNFGSEGLTLSGGWFTALARDTKPTVIAPKLTISGNCILIVDAITIQ
jgi:sugar lactone lactonase YvrE